MKVIKSDMCNKSMNLDMYIATQSLNLTVKYPLKFSRKNYIKTHNFTFLKLFENNTRQMGASSNHK